MGTQRLLEIHLPSSVRDCHLLEPGHLCSQSGSPLLPPSLLRIPVHRDSCINTDKHLRSLSQPFASPTPEEEYLYGIEWNKLPLFAPHLFDIMDLIDSDESSSEDEDHMPPNFLDEQFEEKILVPTAG